MAAKLVRIQREIGELVELTDRRRAERERRRRASLPGEPSEAGLR